MQVHIEGNGINKWANKLYFAEVRSFLKWCNFRRDCVSSYVNGTEGI